METHGNILECMHSEVVVLLALVGGILIQGVLFFLHIPCSPFPMWISFAAAFLALLVSDWRRAIQFVLLTTVVFVLTAYTFSYTGTDAKAYHYPQQILLKEGWNPIYCSAIEKFNEMVGSYEFCRVHTLFLPDLNAMCGALIGLSTGLMVADSFLNYIVLLVLFRVAFRFASFVWKCGTFAALVFAFAVSIQTRMTAFLAGHVDYLSYGAILTLLLCAYMWWRSRSAEDLVLACLTAAIGMLVKTTSLVCCGLTCALLVLFTWRDRRIWIAASVVAVTVLIVGAHPLLTSLHHYKCPFYPTMSFSREIPIIDITGDFTGNADAMSMGWFSRVAYAWISPALVVKVKSLLAHAPFAPEFYVAGGVEGFGSFFRMLLGLSVVALVLSRKNVIIFMAAFVFLLSNLAPIKYIGYGRYFSQIWLIPVLSVYNLMYESRLGLWKFLGIHMLRVMGCCAFALLAIWIGLRTIAYQGRMLQFEALRQEGLQSIAACREASLPSSMKTSLSAVYRATCSGLDFHPRQVEEDVSHADPVMLVVASFPVRSRVQDLNRRYPIINGIQQFCAYEWLSAFSKWPRVVWSGKQGGFVK